ncbi:MAG: ATP-dependent DNA helicase [Nitrososphaeria archaeon]
MSYFPYQYYREGQLESIEVIKSCIENKQNLIFEATSGYGKTVSALSASLEAAEKLNLSVLYLCRTKREIEHVIDETKKIQKRKHFPFSFLFSKNELCLFYQSQNLDNLSLNILCKYVNTFNLCYYKSNCYFLDQQILSKIIFNTENLESLLLQAKIYHVCPYELLRRLSLSSRLCIMTYNSFLQDLLFSNFILSSQGYSKTIIILDECHNLLDILSEIFTFKIKEKDIEQSISEAQRLGLHKLVGWLSSLYPLFNRICFIVDKISAHDKSLIKSELKSFNLDKINDLQNMLSSCLSTVFITSYKSLPYVAKNLIKIHTFLNYLLLYLNRQNILLYVDTNCKEKILTFINVDPTIEFSFLLNKFWSFIMMSATIGSPKIYSTILKLDPTKTKYYSISSQDLIKKIQIIIDTGLTTKYKERTVDLFKKIAGRIYNICTILPVNIGVFFSSYKVLKETEKILFTAYDVKRPFFKESPSMTLKEADKICSSFKSYKNKGALLFAVQGGRFSEGENFQGGEMRSVIVVGLSLPPPTKQIFLRMSYIKRTFSQNAFLISMLEPAIKKAVQSIGRVTRNTSSSIVFLLDSRFASKSIFGLLPEWIQKNAICTNLDDNKVEKLLNNFSSFSLQDF